MSVVKKVRSFFMGPSISAEPSPDISEKDISSDNLSDTDIVTIKKKLAKLGDAWVNVSPNSYLEDQICSKIFPEHIKNSQTIFISSITPSMTDAVKLLRVLNQKNALFGPSHVGLQFGDVVIDWNQSSLVHIGDVKASTATVLFDVNDSVKVTYTPELERRTLDFIKRWNLSKTYSKISCNCHKFVDAFLAEVLSLSIDQCLKGPVAKYIKWVIKTGEATPFIETQQGVRRVFKSHQDLEEFEKNLPNGALTKEDQKLLKVFHRGYQLQENARFERDPNFQPLPCRHGGLTMMYEQL